MAISEESIKLLVELANAKFQDPHRTQEDLLQARALFQEALEGSLEIYGTDSEYSGMIYNSLGLVFCQLEDDYFEEGEEAFAAAQSAYKTPEYLAIVLNNHADLLLKEARLIDDEIEELKELVRKEREAPPRPLLPTRRERLGKAIRQAAGNIRRAWNKDQTVEAQGRPRDITSELTATMQEATDTYRRAAELQRRALQLKQKENDSASSTPEIGSSSGPGTRSGSSSNAGSGSRADSGAGDANANGPVKTSSSRSVALYNGPKYGGQAPSNNKNGYLPEYKTPAQIFAALEEVAIGQYAAKRGLANAASQHMKRMRLTPEERAITDKSNVLLVGPTGCGKTLLAEALAKIISVPFYRTEATKLTASGYVGEDVQSSLTGLLRVCNFDVERAQTGIIFIDEIDKKARHSGSQLDVGGKSVQEEMLTILEGTKISVPGKNKGETIEIDTTNILFVVGGAFVGLGEIAQERLSSNGATIGFSANLRNKEEDPNSYLKHLTAADFVKFGLIPELIGRLPNRLYIETLTVEQLERILTEPKKAILLQKRILMAGVTDIKFTRSAVRAMASEAHKIGTNGRALREIVEQIMEPVVFAEPREIVITQEMVRNRRKEIAAANEESANVKARLMPDYVVDDEPVALLFEAQTNAH